jgi:energy-converting hydrogenase B subunit D
VIPLQLAILLFVAIAGTAVVLSRDPLRQAIVNGAYGLVLAMLFVVFQAPDVALSMLVVGSIAYPLILVVSIKKVRVEEDGEDE